MEYLRSSLSESLVTVTPDGYTCNIRSIPNNASVPRCWGDLIRRAASCRIIHGLRQPRFGTNVVLTGAAELRGTPYLFVCVLRAKILLPAKTFAGRYWTCSIHKQLVINLG
jgi:hypothetical protein